MALLRIVFEGGSWDGQISQIDAAGSGRAERWDKENDQILVYRRSERTQSVKWPHETRNGLRYTTEEATVYELAETKPSLAARMASGEWSPKKRDKTAKAKKTATAAKGARKPAKKAAAKKPAKAQSSLF